MVLKNGEGYYTMCPVQVTGTEVEKKKRNGRNIWSNNGWGFSKINDRCQNIDLNSSKNSKKDKYQKKSTSRHILLKLQKTKDKQSSNQMEKESAFS